MHVDTGVMKGPYNPESFNFNFPSHFLKKQLSNYHYASEFSKYFGTPTPSPQDSNYCLFL